MHFFRTDNTEIFFHNVGDEYDIVILTTVQCLPIREIKIREISVNNK